MIPNSLDLALDQEISLGALRKIRADQVAANETPLRLNFCLTDDSQLSAVLALPNFLPVERYRQTKKLSDREVGAVECFRFFAPAA
jgi:hypothetical protein